MNSGMGESLRGQRAYAVLAAATAGESALAECLQANSNDHDARFQLAVVLVSRHEFDAAMEQLFAILDKQADYKQRAAREMVVTIINLLTANDHEQTAACRWRLSSVLGK